MIKTNYFMIHLFYTSSLYVCEPNALSKKKFYFAFSYLTSTVSERFPVKYDSLV